MKIKSVRPETVRPGTVVSRSDGPRLTDGCFKRTIKCYQLLCEKVAKKIQSVRPGTVVSRSDDPPSDQWLFQTYYRVLSIGKCIICKRTRQGGAWYGNFPEFFPGNRVAKAPRAKPGKSWRHRVGKSRIRKKKNFRIRSFERHRIDRERS